MRMFMWSIPPDFEPAGVCGGWGRASSYGISITKESI
jgi:hypothetical protein